MTTAADQFNDTPSPTNLQEPFVYLANNVVELVETAKRELERDREAAKASLATASSILRSEIERRSRARGARPDALAAWQIARVRAFIGENLHRTTHTKDLSGAKRSTFLAVLQTSLRRTTARLRGEETAGVGVSSNDYQFGIAERNSPERRLFRSSTSVQALQSGAWSKSIQLEARAWARMRTIQ
jgi:hypothetical protein